jgi:hypothetical protein
LASSSDDPHAGNTNAIAAIVITPVIIVIRSLPEGIESIHDQLYAASVSMVPHHGWQTDSPNRDE